MDLQRWTISRAAAKAMPESERALFFLLGHAINEVNVLNKLFYLSNQYDGSEKWRQHAHMTQGMVLARVLVGKLWESWRLFTDGFFRAQLSKEYDALLDVDAKAALKELQRYFGRDNLINRLRNSFAFHYDIDEVRRILSQELDENELVSYMAETNGNTLHYFSEYAAAAAMLSAISGDAGIAMGRLLDETVQVVRWFNEAAQGIMFAAAERHLLEDNGKIKVDEIDIGAVPTAEDLTIPFFMESRLLSGNNGGGA